MAVRNQVPTNLLERDLRKLYLQWLAGLPRHQDDLATYISLFESQSKALIIRLGGQTASLGALAGFPVPKTLELSPAFGVVYDEMKQAAIKGGIAAGLNATDVARQIVNAGLDQGFNKINRLARTETVSAYWKNTWTSTADTGLVLVWGAENGARTCDYCLVRDGLVVEDPDIRDHPNGRCTLIPTLRSKVDYKGTLQADGSVVQDPEWTGKPEKVEKPEKGDNLSSTDEMGLPSSVAEPVHRSEPRAQATSTGQIGRDLEQRLQGTGIQVEGFTDAVGIAPEVASKFVETVTNLIDEFPALKGMKAIRIAPSTSKDSMAFASFNRQSKSVQGAGINLNSRFTGDYQETVSKSIKHGHFHARSDVDPIEYITTHEMGHLVDLATGKRARNQVRRIIENNGGDVSLYAQVSPAEALAEAFATVRTSPEIATPAEKALVEYLLQLLAKAAP